MITSCCSVGLKRLWPEAWNSKYSNALLDISDSGFLFLYLRCIFLHLFFLTYHVRPWYFKLFDCFPCCPEWCLPFFLLLLYFINRIRPDITVMVDWALKINYIYIYQQDFFCPFIPSCLQLKYMQRVLSHGFRINEFIEFCLWWHCHCWRMLRLTIHGCFICDSTGMTSGQTCNTPQNIWFCTVQEWRPKETLKNFKYK